MEQKFEVGDKVESIFLVGVGVIVGFHEDDTEIAKINGKAKPQFVVPMEKYKDCIHISYLELAGRNEDSSKQILEKFMAGTKFKIDDVPTNSLDMLVNAIIRGNKIEEQKYIDINGFRVPEPCYDLSEISGYVFVVYLHDIVETEANKVPVYYSEAYHNGLVHMSYEAAQIHQEALLSFTKKNEKV